MVANETAGEPRVECGTTAATMDLDPLAVPLLSTHCLWINADIQGTKRTVSHKNMTPGSAHYYRVIAMNGVDNGTPTDVKGARTTSPTRPDKPGNPVSVPIATQLLKAAKRSICTGMSRPKTAGILLALHPVQVQRRTFNATTNRWENWSSWADLRTSDAALTAVIGSGSNVDFPAAPTTDGPPVTVYISLGDAFNVKIMNVDHGVDNDRKGRVQVPHPLDAEQCTDGQRP